ncbi:hypothetical protein K432DRAFT_427968 [Lepidopterella palustris CBS 459.81]|uniref:Clr5 domain-containing protein n=1 Tax=Lepidopterella palustris CBS 459.81 TaxID=1314670 RepID=A0A8E2JCL8_9PEZI|nr:hypothetical protein K432DRAFT_427968 [Lepidopterella palustris CBS 459.81]
MSNPQQLQWKEPPAPRPKPVSPQLWDERKEELCELFPKMKLDDLMAMMRTKHNFTPSRRQYVFQFKKWDLHKYNTANTINSTPSNYSACLSQTSSDQHRLISVRNKRERPRDLPMKRQKLSEYMAQRQHGEKPDQRVRVLQTGSSRDQTRTAGEAFPGSEDNKNPAIFDGQCRRDE